MLERPVWIFSEAEYDPGFQGGGGESGGGGSSGSWAEDGVVEPEDLPLENQWNPPPGGRPPSAPPKGSGTQSPNYHSGGTNQTDDGTSTTASPAIWPPTDWPPKGWSKEVAPDGDSASWYAQQYACIRQGGNFSSSGTCSLTKSTLNCNREAWEVPDALNKKCISAQQLMDLANDYADCRLNGGTFDEASMECLPSKSNRKTWIYVGLALIPIALIVGSMWKEKET